MTDLIDKRQRLAAVHLLTAIELPARVDDVAEVMLDAARVFPGIRTDEIIPTGRTDSLERAAALIEEMLEEQYRAYELTPEATDYLEKAEATEPHQPPAPITPFADALIASERALRPFAHLCDEMAAYADDVRFGTHLTIGDLRTARAAHDELLTLMSELSLIGEQGAAA